MRQSGNEEGAWWTLDLEPRPRWKGYSINTEGHYSMAEYSQTPITPASWMVGGNRWQALCMQPLSLRTRLGGLEHLFREQSGTGIEHN